MTQSTDNVAQYVSANKNIISTNTHTHKKCIVFINQRIQIHDQHSVCDFYLLVTYYNLYGCM